MATQTPLSSATSYLPAATYLRFADLRTVADLISDDGDRVGVQADGSVDAATVAADANLAQALLSACGLVESAAMKGARYTPDDLTAIAATTSAAQGMMFLMIARLTTGLLFERRPDKGKPSPAYDLALKQIEALMAGVQVFGTVETADAQTMEATVETRADVEARDGTTYQARRFFGRRSNRSSDF